MKTLTIILAVILSAGLAIYLAMDRMDKVEAPAKGREPKQKTRGGLVFLGVIVLAFLLVWPVIRSYERSGEKEPAERLLDSKPPTFAEGDTLGGAEIEGRAYLVLGIKDEEGNRTLWLVPKDKPAKKKRNI